MFLFVLDIFRVYLERMEWLIWSIDDRGEVEYRELSLILFLFLFFYVYYIMKIKYGENKCMEIDLLNVIIIFFRWVSFIN